MSVLARLWTRLLGTRCPVCRDYVPLGRMDDHRDNNHAGDLT